MNEIEQHKVYFRIFLILSIISVVNIATNSFISNTYGINNTGAISYFIGMSVSYILGSLVGGVIIAVTNLIFGFALLWMGIAYYEYWYISKLKKSKSETNLLGTKKGDND